MKKAGFTMIELIFVIVILGILAAVAIPRLNNTQGIARQTNAEAFIGSINRSAGADMWAKSVTDGNGSIATGFTLSTYIDIPDGYGTFTLSNCVGTPTTAVATIGSAVGSGTGNIYCRDGNLTNPPRFGFATDLNTTYQ